MREAIVVLLLGGFVLLVPVEARANEVEFAILRGDEDHDGTADVFFSEIWVEVAGATQVRMFDGLNWVSFDGGGGDYWVETEDFGTLADLLNHISGGFTLEITTPGNVSTYQYNVSGDAAAVAGLFPVPIPEITDVSWAGNTATLSWDWTGGDLNAVDSLGVLAGAHTGVNCVDFYDKASDDDPPNYIPKTVLHVNDIIFPAPPGTYDEIELIVGYANEAAVDGAGGTVVTGWTHTGGDELFGSVDDEVFEIIISEDAVPEPATMVLMGLGGLGLLLRRKRA